MNKIIIVLVMLTILIVANIISNAIREYGMAVCDECGEKAILKNGLCKECDDYFFGDR